MSGEPAGLEGGWLLEGADGDGGPVRLVIADRDLARSELGITIGRHVELCERVIADPTVSRRHCRLGLDAGRLAIEDLNSLNGTLLDGYEVPRFQPAPLRTGQELVLGRVTLRLSRLGPGARA
jgi:pSer/pThr/pTyr-binding forkhead associated (FHA) protein